MQLILVINRRTRVGYYANKFSTLIPINPLGLIVHGLCFLGVNVLAIECIRLKWHLATDWSETVDHWRAYNLLDSTVLHYIVSVVRISLVPTCSLFFTAYILDFSSSKNLS